MLRYVHLLKFNAPDWKLSTCTCFSFQKQYKCKHVLGIAVSKKLFTIPESAKMDVIGKKRKVGRPLKARVALLVN